MFFGICGESSVASAHVAPEEALLITAKRHCQHALCDNENGYGMIQVTYTHDWLMEQGDCDWTVLIISRGSCTTDGSGIIKFKDDNNRTQDSRDLVYLDSVIMAVLNKQAVLAMQSCFAKLFSQKYCCQCCSHTI
jgi:hypothetical protein